MHGEDGFELLDQLRGKLLLGQIVWRFDYYRDQAIVFSLSIVALLLSFSADLFEGLLAKQAKGLFRFSIWTTEFWLFWHFVFAQYAIAENPD